MHQPLDFTRLDGANQANRWRGFVAGYGRSVGVANQMHFLGHFLRFYFGSVMWADF
jgi:hypothetical protein